MHRDAGILDPILRNAGAFLSHDCLLAEALDLECCINATLRRHSRSSLRMLVMAVSMISKKNEHKWETDLAPFLRHFHPAETAGCHPWCCVGLSCPQICFARSWAPVLPVLIGGKHNLPFDLSNPALVWIPHGTFSATHESQLLWNRRQQCRHNHQVGNLPLQILKGRSCSIKQ